MNDSWFEPTIPPFRPLLSFYLSITTFYLPQLSSKAKLRKVFSFDVLQCTPFSIIRHKVEFKPRIIHFVLIKHYVVCCLLE